MLFRSIAGEGESSRLYQSLVYRQQIAQDVSADADLRENTGLFAVTATLASGKTVAQVEKALRAEMKKLTETKVTPTELEKAKNMVITAALRRGETTLGKGSALRDAIIYQHDASYANRRLERLQAVTAADVQRVAKKILSTKPVVVTYTSGGSK